MPKFVQQYTYDDFFNVMRGGLKTLGFIAKKVGCARQTAVTYLNEMKEKGLVEKISVDEGQLFVWKIKNEQ